MFKLLLFKTVCALLWRRRRKKKRKTRMRNLSSFRVETVISGKKERRTEREAERWEAGVGEGEGRERRGRDGGLGGGGGRRDRAYGVSKELGVLRPVNQCGYNLVFYAQSTSTVISWRQHMEKRERKKAMGKEGVRSERE